ncbi:hypothetical protein CKO45_16440, partial [Paracraurococcus ruber]|nr:hypothetical protein [Paracraurococcus ruber]
MRTITGLFDSRPDAERAVEYMVQHHGIDRNLIQVHAAGTENATAGTFEPRSEDHHGFIAALQDLGLPEEDSLSYAEGMRRGGILVSVRAPQDRLDAIADAFESNGAVDLDSREAEWRQGGWAGGGGFVDQGQAQRDHQRGSGHAAARPADRDQARLGAIGHGAPGHGPGAGGMAAPTGRGDAGLGVIGSRSAGSSATPDSLPAVNPDAGNAGWTGGGGGIAAAAARNPGGSNDDIGSTYAGTRYVGARATDEDITKPVNAGVASTPAVRPAGPAALAAASSGASTAG